MSSTKPSQNPEKFTIALLWKNPAFNNKMKHLILSNDNGSVKTLNDFVVLKSRSFRIISTRDFCDEDCPYPDQQVIDLLAHCYSGLHLFILAIDSENVQVEKIGSQIRKFQDIFGQTITEHLVVMFDKYMSNTSLDQLKETFNIELGTLSEHLVHDCMKWCKTRPVFQYHYRDYSEEVVKRRKNDLKWTRDADPPPCNHERSGPHAASSRPANLQSTSNVRTETEPEQTIGESNGLRSGDTFNIVLLGLTGTGKSASGNTILTAMNPHLKPKQLFESRPSSIPITTKCQFKTIRSLYSRRVGVVDTPDFLNDEINDQAQVEECKKFCQPGHYVVLLVIQMGRFTEGEKGMLERLEMKLDCRIRENTIVLLTHGENAKGNVQSFIDERSHLRHIVNECGNRCHVFKNTSKEPKQVMELFKKIPDYETIFPEFTEKQSLIGCRVG
ncbi:GTPase IMAP family member 6-like isoform X2 [Stegastes partitus]|uniref:GTPase IMAP family member 6-like isoform X2 n=1 Tax=Stegastes partitus TaxID=144197 RepID=A0A3B5A0W9_9TELE|nr:PREDICTED: GTPase IMAP family member 6-like isoform X2 [Stegastes partitus]